MATYKVIQDIEAEDKLIGPLTLRQFIYAAIGATFLYLSYLATTKGAAFMLVFFLPISAVMGFFAFPWMRDQPTEVWALAKIRFMLKPRRRIWSQDGIKDLVTITAPKQITEVYTNGLSQQEVRSRLHALAMTIDTRGWAAKSAQLNIGAGGVGIDASDRLVAPSLPQPVDYADVRASDDILDEQNNANAQRLQSMIDQKAKSHREQLMASLQSNTPQAPAKQQPANYWFLNKPTTPGAVPRNMVTFNTQVVTPGTSDNGSDSPPAPDEASILAELDAHKQQAADVKYGHTHVVQPLSAQQPPSDISLPPPVASATAAVPTPDPVPTSPQDAAQNAQAPVTPAAQTAILQLASNDDLNISTLAREAERAAPQDEVVIKLH